MNIQINYALKLKLIKIFMNFTLLQENKLKLIKGPSFD